MKLPNWFRITWWIVLLGVLSYSLSVRFDGFKSGDVSYLDGLVLLVWFALALVPVFKEIELLGLKLRQEDQNTPKDQTSALKKTTENMETMKTSSYKETMKLFDNALVVEQEEILKNLMKEINPASVEEKEDILYREVAINQISLTFEKVYYAIYGSQIKTLQFLNETPDQFASGSALKVFYDSAKSDYPEFYQSYGFENWTNFLIETVLVLREGKMYGITVRGHEFLKYLLEQNYSFVRSG